MKITLDKARELLEAMGYEVAEQAEQDPVAWEHFGIPSVNGKQTEKEPVAKFLEDNLVVENERVDKSGHRVLEIREEELLRIMELYAANVQQAEQAPVVCVECGKPTMHMGNKCYVCCQKDTKDLEDALKSWDAAPVSTKDPCHPWQDLTDDEIEEIGKSYFDEWSFGFARAVIAAYKEKNRV